MVLSKNQRSKAYCYKKSHVTVFLQTIDMLDKVFEQLTRPSVWTPAITIIRFEPITSESTATAEPS